ncbi:RN169 ligase, partial [Leiothrix lutea]|nr:RN169 ligase [Leiothrix lutea]
PDFIFRAPIKLSKTGELREEYESQLRKLREEKLQEEKTSEDLIHKFILDDVDMGKRKMEEQQKKDESAVLKGNQDCFPERLSDSENEEPFQGKQTHRSAFVSKTSAYSFAFLSGNLISKVERSRSCNDTIQERSKSRQRSAPATKTKVQAVSGNRVHWHFDTIEDSKALSSQDHRMVWVGRNLKVHPTPCPGQGDPPLSQVASSPIQPGLEHFQGWGSHPAALARMFHLLMLTPLLLGIRTVLEMTRNVALNHRIIQVGRDLQGHQIQPAPPQSPLTHIPKCHIQAPLIPGPSLYSFSPTAWKGAKSNLKIISFEEDGFLQPGWCSASWLLLVFTESSRLEETFKVIQCSCQLNTTKWAEKTHFKARVSCSCPTSAVEGAVSGRGCQGQLCTAAIRSGGLPSCVQLLERLSQLCCLSLQNILGEQPPLLRRGRKRRCKTKHLEHNGSVKRLRHVAGEVGLPPEVRDVEQKLQQEEEDRRLALHLQRIFDSENRTVDRRKVRVDRYLLRSKSTLGAK